MSRKSNELCSSCEDYVSQKPSEAKDAVLINSL